MVAGREYLTPRPQGPAWAVPLPSEPGGHRDRLGRPLVRWRTRWRQLARLALQACPGRAYRLGAYWTDGDGGCGLAPSTLLRQRLKKSFDVTVSTPPGNCAFVPTIGPPGVGSGMFPHIAFLAQ